MNHGRDARSVSSVLTINRHWIRLSPAFSPPREARPQPDRRRNLLLMGLSGRRFVNTNLPRPKHRILPRYLVSLQKRRFPGDRSVPFICGPGRNHCPINPAVLSNRFAFVALEPNDLHGASKVQARRFNQLCGEGHQRVGISANRRAGQILVYT